MPSRLNPSSAHVFAVALHLTSFEFLGRVIETTPAAGAKAILSFVLQRSRAEQRLEEAVSSQ